MYIYFWLIIADVMRRSIIIEHTLKCASRRMFLLTSKQSDFTLNTEWIPFDRKKKKIWCKRVNCSVWLNVSKSDMCPWSNAELQLHKQTKLGKWKQDGGKNTSANTKMDLLLCDGSIIHNASSNVSVCWLARVFMTTLPKCFEVIFKHHQPLH